MINSTGAVSFSDIQTEFGGTNPIGLNEYFQNNNNDYTQEVDGIPNTGSAISLSQFRGKKKKLIIQLSGTQITNIANTNFSYASFTNISGNNKISFNLDVECDVLIVGGGGGGGAGWATNRNWEGGYPGIGGYGASFKETKIKFLANREYVITVGTGGTSAHQYGKDFRSSSANNGTQSNIKLNNSNISVANGGAKGSPQWLRHWRYATGASGGVNGLPSSITGVQKYYAGAGWGGSGWIIDNNDSRYRSPGVEIGARGAGKGGGGSPGRQTSSTKNGGNAQPNTGSGGGGAAGYTSSYPTIRDVGGRGGDGIVIIRWTN